MQPLLDRADPAGTAASCAAPAAAGERHERTIQPALRRTVHPAEHAPFESVIAMAAAAASGGDGNQPGS